MDKKRFPLALGLASMVLGLVTIPAPGAAATRARASAVCELSLNSISATGAHQGQRIKATTPPTAGVTSQAPDKFAPGMTRLSGSWMSESLIPYSMLHQGKVVIGSTMYAASWEQYAADESVHLGRVGGGWDSFTFFEESRYDEGAKPGAVARRHEYGLRSDGALARWRISDKGWVAAGTYPGFAAVKTMALISQTRTYDTFLANTRGGALYTIRIPVTNPMKPIVTRVRASTWQAFDTLIAERCGQYGTLLLGIDKHTSSAYLYAVGHANGTATVIQSLGKVPNVHTAPVYFRSTGVPWATPPLNGD
ncbi:hypothetical protein E1218_10700 [Kribbella turkmenica]|uniref:Uncharacterized protein n=2 Tax=Kribbella turkmenica TaxID=2530375 RepID=A0A4R4XA32_9ACTN|nr:hypothetical protein E1218_10700 [Kribbella turkmenica]